jgi:hypothetical protein
MLKPKLLCAGLFFSLVAGLPGGVVAAKDIVIVANDDDPCLCWSSDDLKRENNVLKVPVKEGDVLHFAFGDAPSLTHGIKTKNPQDKTKIQKRGDPTAPGAFLQELGDGTSRFGPQIDPTKPNEEITQVKVLSNFQGTLELECSVHHQAMPMTLTRSN